MNASLLIASLFFAVAATVEWARLPLLARLHTGVATALALAGASHSAAAVVHARDGLAALAAVAAVGGAVGMLFSALTFVRWSAARR